MTDAVQLERDRLLAAVLALIERLGGGARDEPARDALLSQLLVLQRTAIPAYDRIVRHACALAPNGRGAPIDGPLHWPAIPTDVFRFARIALHEPELDVRVFRTSGTTQSERGVHPLRQLAAYDRAAYASGRYFVFPDRERMKLCVLAPAASELSDSSLSYMFDRFGAWFGIGPSAYVMADGELDLARLEQVLEAAISTAEPIALLGTSFAFVHADDGLGARTFALPTGSRIVQTGGFKGRSREVSPEAMLELLCTRYGVPESHVIAEYGMTELSSQLYESTLRDAVLGREVGPRRLLAPGWVRLSIVDPESLEAPPEDASRVEGLLRLDDLANVDTACAIQTADRACWLEGGVRVLGRAQGATPRGCSLAVDAAVRERTQEGS